MLLVIKLMVVIELKKTVMENIFFQYNVLIGGRNFYDQPISDQIRKYDEIRKTATGKRNDYKQDVC